MFSGYICYNKFSSAWKFSQDWECDNLCYETKGAVILARASWHSPRQFLATVWELAWTTDHSQQALCMQTPCVWKLREAWSESIICQVVSVRKY